MNATVETGSLAALQTAAIVVFTTEGPHLVGALAQEADQLAGGLLSTVLTQGDFTGRPTDVRVLHVPGDTLRRFVLAGVGKPGELTLERLRNAAGKAATTLRELGVKSAAYALPAPGDLQWKGAAPDAEALAQAVGEGALLSLYQLNLYRTSDEEAKQLDAIRLVASDAEAAERGLATARHLQEATDLARTLVLHPGNVLTPIRFADEARRAGEACGLSVTVLDEEALAKLGFDCLLTVAKGSDQPPRFIRLDWNGGEAGAAPVAVVGKGLTFDSGGIGIKPGPGMEKMKYDMAGGAATLGILVAAARLKLPLNVVGLIAACENMPSERAVKPGDVVTSYAGLTVEINDTDAEGRVVLADALAYAVKDVKAKAIVDMATLTGAVGIALGREVMGVMGNDQPMVEAVIAAGDRSGDRGWQLPLDETLEELLKSDIADLKNYGGRWAGASAAAAFLAKFVGETPWVHLDIAGTAWVDADKGYRPKGPTGSPIRMVVEWLRTLS